MSKHFKTKPVKDLYKYNFYIPDYQRGYKWTVQQVWDLIGDIENYEPEKNDFYCLQPLVVKKNDKVKQLFGNNQDTYEVVDGQQRLTTLYMILLSLKIKQDGIYKIRYETRKSSAEFLKSIKEKLDNVILNYSENCTVKKITESINDKWQKFIENKENKEYNNIDNYHFFSAFLTIQFRIMKMPLESAEKLLKKIQENTHFIWYEDTIHDNAKQLFRILNSGKTELTNAELIKALFINNCKEKFKDDGTRFQERIQNEIAGEWDHIEKTLNDDHFWYFISNEKDTTKYPVRIDLLFDIYVQNNREKNDSLYTYRHFTNSNKDLFDEWSEVKKLFYRLMEWFENNELYHLIGYIVYRDFEKINQLIKKSKENITKTEFKEYLIKTIQGEFQDKKNEIYKLENLNYCNTKEVENILLLHNIETYQRDDDAFRFPFHRLKKKKWSIEHIHAQNAEKFKTKKEVCDWLNDLSEYLKLQNKDSNDSKEVTDLTSEIKNLIEQIENIEKEEIHEWNNDIREKISKIKDETDAYFDVHHIGNLALLDGSTNSSLGNSSFTVKRKKIIELDRQLRNKSKEKKPFIPICTKNAFLKYYTEDVSSLLYWEQKDRENYVADIKRLLNKYLPENGDCNAK